jgi:uncharacterized ferritin-like protein (DUF455 family)
MQSIYHGISSHAFHSNFNTKNSLKNTSLEYLPDEFAQDWLKVANDEAKVGFIIHDEY